MHRSITSDIYGAKQNTKYGICASTHLSFHFNPLSPILTKFLNNGKLLNPIVLAMTRYP